MVSQQFNSPRVETFGLKTAYKKFVIRTKGKIVEKKELLCDLGSLTTYNTNVKKSSTLKILGPKNTWS